MAAAVDAAAAAGGASEAMEKAMTRRDSNPVRACLLVAVALVALAAKPAATPPKTFDSPEAAVDALVAAVNSADPKQEMVGIFGSGATDLIASGDTVADENVRKDFLEGYGEKHSIEKSGDDKRILVYGNDDFPFPVPIMQKDGKWHFDTPAGREEILARRVGRNELSTIQVCLAIVDAEREYASKDRNGDGLFDYAERILSTPGKKDGLYWPSEPNEPESPLGELVADARSEGYGKKQGAPYHGYYFKILKAQGPHADGGAYSYMVRGRMIGGFALVAYPAQYGNSGIMTFVVNHDGVVHSKDLGPNTAKIASAMTKYDPDQTWKTEEDASPNASQ